MTTRSGVAAGEEQRSQLANILALLAKASANRPHRDCTESPTLRLHGQTQESGDVVRSRGSADRCRAGDRGDPHAPIYGHDVIVFHVSDEAEVHFPFEGMCDLKDLESDETMLVGCRGHPCRLP
ncbi:MAG: hypothetical protein R3C02_23215 [Planctomycetaceae bacterium]